RLLRRGVAVPAALMAATFAPVVASAAAPIALTSSVARGAVAFAAGKTPAAISAGGIGLAEGVKQAMLMTKLKMVTTVLLVFCLTFIGGALAAYAAWNYQALDALPPEKVAEKAPEKQREKELGERFEVQTGHSHLVSGVALSGDGALAITSSE